MCYVFEQSATAIRDRMLLPGQKLVTWASDQTTKDKKFLAEYQKVNGSMYIGKSGAEAQKYVKSIVNVNPKLQKWLLDYADKARN